MADAAKLERAGRLQVVELEPHRAPRDDAQRARFNGGRLDMQGHGVSCAGCPGALYQRRVEGTSNARRAADWEDPVGEPLREDVICH